MVVHGYPLSSINLDQNTFIWAADKITCVAKYHLTWLSFLVGSISFFNVLQTVVSIAYRHIDKNTKYNSQPQIKGLQCFLHRNGTALELCTWVLVALGSARITTHKRWPSSSAQEQTLVMWRSRSTECLAWHLGYRSLIVWIIVWEVVGDYHWWKVAPIGLAQICSINIQMQ